ncbi:hypothetical protein nvc2_079 [Namao virus]|nr:hypothetical protein nvc2_079 [Namao virus]
MKTIFDLKSLLRNYKLFLYSIFLSFVFLPCLSHVTNQTPILTNNTVYPLSDSTGFVDFLIYWPLPVILVLICLGICAYYKKGQEIYHSADSVIGLEQDVVFYL